MVKQEILCDRCGQAIEADRTLLTVECGPIRPRQTTIDVCLLCAEKLMVWIGEPKTNGTAQS